DAELSLHVASTSTPKSDVGSACQKLAFLYTSERDFCVSSTQHLQGMNLAVIRQLQMLGYIVIELSHCEISSMEIQKDEDLDKLIMEKINAAIGFQMFMIEEGENS
ncbi:hypothetical protein EGW08_000899, partial [Elysia chlorotica]